MTNLSDLFPSGGGKTVSFTASGNITAAGKPVIINTDGTVTEVSGSAAVVGTPTVILSTTDFDSTDALCVTSGDQNVGGLADYNGGAGVTGESFVLTASATTITKSTLAYQFTANTPQYIACCYDSINDRVVMVWNEEVGGTHTLYARVGTISGTGASAAISYGTAVSVGTSTHRFYFANVEFDPDTGNFVIFWASQENSWYGYAWVGTVTGGSYDTVTMGTSSVVVASSATEYNNLVYDPDTDRMIFTYLSSGFFGKVGTVSGTSTSATVSVGAAGEMGSSLNANGIAPVYDPVNDKVVVVISDDLALDVGVGTVTGGGTNTIAWGSIVTIGVAGDVSNSVVATYDSNANKVIAVFREDGSPYYSYMNDITITGTVPSAGTNTLILTPNSQLRAIEYNATASRTVYLGQDGSDDSAMVLAPASSNLTSTNFVGVSDAAITSSASGDITVRGGIASAGLSSLTIGSKYYVQDAGTITTVSSDVTAGLAISATSLILSGDS